MRGKVKVGRNGFFDLRITPACAGKSPARSSPSGSGRDHPRMCGEKYQSGYYAGKADGSPPHVRGKAAAQIGKTDAFRITPACAGKSAGLRHSCRSQRDHPRMCGEKLGVDTVKPGILGSPPHVRGKVKVIDGKNGMFRITPACAGKRAAIRHIVKSCRDHPRMCGEKSLLTWHSVSMMGSPPHVRGKVKTFSSSIHPSRITPACAGKSQWSQRHYCLP